MLFSSVSVSFPYYCSIYLHFPGFQILESLFQQDQKRLEPLSRLPMPQPNGDPIIDDPLRHLLNPFHKFFLLHATRSHGLIWLYLFSVFLSFAWPPQLLAFFGPYALSSLFFPVLLKKAPVIEGTVVHA